MNLLTPFLVRGSSPDFGPPATANEGRGLSPLLVPKPEEHETEAAGRPLPEDPAQLARMFAPLLQPGLRFAGSVHAMMHNPLGTVAQTFDPRAAARFLGGFLTNPSGVTLGRETGTGAIDWLRYAANMGRYLSDHMPLPGSPPTRPPTVGAVLSDARYLRLPVLPPWTVDASEFAGVLSESDTPDKDRRRSPEQQALIDALKSGGGDVSFGRLSKAKFDAINALREANGINALTRRELTVPSNVVKKLVDRRILQGKMSPDEVADVLYSAFHNSRARVFPTRFEHIQQLIRPGERLSNVGFIGQSPRDPNPVVKSGYKKPTRGMR